MGQQVFKIARVTDAQIAAALTKLADEFGPFQLDIQVAAHGLGNVSFPDQHNDTWKQVLGLRSELIDHFVGSIANVRVHYYRGGHQAQVWEKSPVLDDLSVDIQGVDPQRVKVAARIIDLFRPVPLPNPMGPNGALEAHRAIQESTLNRLQRQTEQLFEQTIDYRRQIDESVREKEAALEASTQRKLDASEAQLEEQRAALRKEKEDLDTRRKAIDDSDNTHARRQIRDRMLADVSERVQHFGMSEATLAARGPVARGMLVLLSFLFAAFLWTAAELSLSRVQPSSGLSGVSAPAAIASGSGASQQTNTGLRPAPQLTQASSAERIALWIRLTLISVGFAASMVYYIRWQNNWATQFAATEQSLKQFHIDVNRANWVVETCLEWRKETHSEIPAPLVSSLTRSLFSDREPTTQVLHPADELASALLGSASKLQLDVAGNKIEIDKPGKIPKTTTTGAD